jgi:uncharacterized protein YeaO (DUF488 family)
MPIRTRRWNDPPDAGDGLRLLICRYRPRGVAKRDETWDRWMPQLGPSVELHAAYYGKGGRDPLPWSAYRSQYLREMRQQRETIAELARRVAADETITLLCSSACVDERRCHRSVLRDLMMKEVAKLKTNE